MRFNLILFFSCCFLQSLFSGQQHGTADRIEKVFSQAINDSVTVDVFLKYDGAGEAIHYFSNVNTAVCEDGLCRLMVIDVYWDLLGNFLKYELPGGQALTKLDHEEFTREDHEQLYKILADRSSILRDYPAEDLIVGNNSTKNEKADAVTAATRADVKDAVVSGAVYSTYVLWHIVNGPIATRIASHSKPFLTEGRIGKMFYSENFYYQYFALNSIAPEDSLKYLPEVVHLVKNGISYIPYFAIDNVPPSAWTIDSLQISLLRHFSVSDFEMKNSILSKIASVPLAEESVELLIKAMAGLTENQILKAISILERNELRLTAHARSMLKKWTDHADKRISKPVQTILSKTK